MEDPVLYTGMPCNGPSPDHFQKRLAVQGHSTLYRKDVTVPAGTPCDLSNV